MNLSNNWRNRYEIEAVAVEIFLEGGINIVGVSTYRAPNFPTKLRLWNCFFNKILNISKNKCLVIRRDLNVQSNIGGSTIVNFSDNCLSRALKGFNLIILNYGSRTYLSSRDKTNVLDLTLADPSLAALSKWETSNELLASDHVVINITIKNLLFQNVSIRPSDQT